MFATEYNLYSKILVFKVNFLSNKNGLGYSQLAPHVLLREKSHVHGLFVFFILIISQSSRTMTLTKETKKRKFIKIQHILGIKISLYINVLDIFFYCSYAPTYVLTFVSLKKINKKNITLDTMQDHCGCTDNVAPDVKKKTKKLQLKLILHK